MQPLRALLLILIAATFAVGGTARAMPAPAAEPPCHEAPASPEKPHPVQAAVNCCVGCMPAPSETAVVLTAGPAERSVYARVETAAEGLTPAPEHGPPRLHV
jgi:hypothetical protein